eukprot:PhM_4_TR272/c0_g1_i1/m.55732
MNPARRQWQEWVRVRARSHAQAPAATNTNPGAAHVIQCASRLMSLKRSHSDNPKESAQAPDFARHALRRLEREGLTKSSYTAEQSTKILMCMAYFQVSSKQHAALLDTLIAAVSAQTYDMTVEGVFPYITSLVSIEHDGFADALKAVAPRIVQLAEEMTPTEIATTADVYANARVFSPELQEALLMSFVKYTPLFKLGEAARIFHAFEGIQVNDKLKTMLQLIAERVAELLVESRHHTTDATASPFSGTFIRIRDIVAIVRVAARVGIRSRTLYHMSCEVAVHNLKDIGPRDTVDIIYALKLAGFHNKHYLQALTANVVESLQFASLRSVSQLSHVLTTTKHTGGSVGTQRQLAARAERLLSRASPSEVVSIVHGFSPSEQSVALDLVNKALQRLSTMTDKMTLSQCLVSLSALGYNSLVKSTPDGFVESLLARAEVLCSAPAAPPPPKLSTESKERIKSVCAEMKASIPECLTLYIS